MKTPPDFFGGSLPDTATFEAKPFKRPGRRFSVVHGLETVTSTNDLAEAWATQTPDRYWGIVANHQTQGKGQRGKTWTAAPGQSLLLSLVLPAALPWARPSIHCAWVATSVAALIEELLTESGHDPDPGRVRIKWPNDVLVDEKKIAGILMEQSQAMVVGLGLNLAQTATDFPNGWDRAGTSLSMLGIRHGSIEEVLERLLRLMEQRLDWLDHGCQELLESEWRRGLDLEGRWVLAQKPGSDARAQLDRLAFDRLVLRHEDGTSSDHAPEEFIRITPWDGGFHL